MSNTITAYFKGRIGVCESLYQYDYGRVMILDDIELPSPFDAYFETTESIEAIPAIGQYNRVAIPNDCLTRNGVVTLHIPVHTGQNDSEVEYKVSFRVVGRARPIDDEDPAELQTAVSQAISLLQHPNYFIEHRLECLQNYKVNTPLDEHGQPYNGTAGQLLRTKGDGSTEWVDEGLPTDEQTAQAVSDWLDAHPEATTTVEDDSLTTAKYKDDSVTSEKLSEAVRKKFDRLKYRIELQDIIEPEPIYTLPVLRTMTQGATSDGTYIYWIDFTSDSDCDLVKSLLSDGTAVARVHIQDYYSAYDVHGNGIAYCDKDDNIYITTVRGNTVLKFDSNLNYVGSKNFFNGKYDRNSAICWMPVNECFCFSPTYSNEIELIHYNQINGGYYGTHGVFPYKSMLKFRRDFGAQYSEQCLCTYGEYILAVCDRHTPGKYSGVSVYTSAGKYLYDIIFDAVTIGEVEAVFVVNDTIYITYADGTVYTASALTNAKGKPLFFSGGSASLNFNYKNSLSYFTVYDAHETAVVSGDLITAGTILESDIPWSYYATIQSDFLRFWVEVDGARAVPIVFDSVNQNYEHGLSQERYATTLTPLSTDGSLALISIGYKFVQNDDKINIEISSVKKEKWVFGSGGTVTKTAFTNARIDGICAVFM